MDILENDLQELGLLGHSIGTVDTTVEHLIERYGEIVGLFYYGWLMAKKRTPSEEVKKAATNAHPKTIERRLGKSVDAGLPLTLTTPKSRYHHSL